MPFAQDFLERIRDGKLGLQEQRHAITPRVREVIYDRRVDSLLWTMLSG
jgi:hypothetical protein